MEIDKEIPRITDEEWLLISRDLDDRHAIFHMFWQMGRPIFTISIQTAAVVWDKESNQTTFLFNPDFWKSLDHYNRVFVIAHEMLHIFLNHCRRFKDAKKSQKIVNKAVDIVDNELLVSKFGFDRSKIQDQEKLCWVDTIFPDEDYPRDKHVEFYLKRLKDQESSESSGTGESGSGQKTVDDHEAMGKDIGDFVPDLKDIDGQLTPKEKDEIEPIIKDHFVPEPDDTAKNSNGEKGQGSSAGSSGTGIWTFLPKIKIIKKRKWETIILKWARKRILPDIKAVERWGRKHRRLTAWDSGGIYLPCEHDMETMVAENCQLDVWFMLDTSGSCKHLADRFWKAAISLPEKRFNVHLFGWNTSVYPVDVTKRQLRLGGGTAFSCIENYIQGKMQTERIRYPDAVFVITDGDSYGAFSPKNPNRWYLFLSNERYRSRIPKNCNVFNLKDFE